MFSSLGPTCYQVPEARSKVGTPEHRVGDHGQQQHHGDRCAHPSTSLALADTVASAVGPYGVSSSLNPPASRNLLLIPRSTKMVAVPTSAYKMTTAKKVIHTPVLAVTASSTFMWL